MIYGYARVSTGSQSLDAQLSQLLTQGCVIFSEKISGIRSDRPQLAALLATVKEGDVVIVTRLDRLARSTRDLLNTLAVLTDRQVGFRSLAESWADTTTPYGRLMVTLLGGIAEFERELIRMRTSEGRLRAMEKGVKFGRPSKLDLAQRCTALQRIAAGERIDVIAHSYNVSGSTISRLQRDPC
jgi:DNA invertase Pin-like site-specific DNA recombinase